MVPATSNRSLHNPDVSPHILPSGVLPRPVRADALEHCVIARESGELVPANLINLSNEGFCVETSHTFEVGERIEMRVLGLGRLPGIVRWFDSHRAGGVLEPYSSGAYDIS
jgi:PilZ domain-containing protein